MGNPRISVNSKMGMLEVLYLNLYKFHEWLMVFCKEYPRDTVQLFEMIYKFIKNEIHFTPKFPQI